MAKINNKENSIVPERKKYFSSLEARLDDKKSGNRPFLSDVLSRELSHIEHDQKT